MKGQKGFTLIELMVVIVIIGILSALAVPKLFGVSAKAKAAEAIEIIGSWESLQSAFVHEQGSAGDFTAIGFADPSSRTGVSKWFNFNDGGTNADSGSISAVAVKDFGACASGDSFKSNFTVLDGTVTHSAPIGLCAASYAINFLP